MLQLLLKIDNIEDNLQTRVYAGGPTFTVDPRRVGLNVARELVNWDLVVINNENRYILGILEEHIEQAIVNLLTARVVQNYLPDIWIKGQLVVQTLT